MGWTDKISSDQQILTSNVTTDLHDLQRAVVTAVVVAAAIVSTAVVVVATAVVTASNICREASRHCAREITSHFFALNLRQILTFVTV
jgi:hypothetical protein